MLRNRRRNTSYVKDFTENDAKTDSEALPKRTIAASMLYYTSLKDTPILNVIPSNYAIQNSKPNRKLTLQEKKQSYLLNIYNLNFKPTTPVAQIQLAQRQAVNSSKTIIIPQNDIKGKVISEMTVFSKVISGSMGGDGTPTDR